MDASTSWMIFTVVVLIMLFVDLGIFNKTPHEVKTKEALIWTGVWITLAMAFNGFVYLSRGPQAGIEFFTGYVVEKSLSVDNIFVFITIFKTFKVPLKFQHRVLFWGIIGAVLLRGLFIGLGSVILTQFHWVFYLFGAFHVFTGIQIALDKGHELDFVESPFIRFCKRVMPLTHEYHDKKFFVNLKGKWMATPLFLVLLAIEFSDVIFAVDSIPAIFAITLDPYIVFTSNIFAILGLRSMYFLLANAALRFIYLSYGLGFILCFVGVKMLIADFYKIPSLVSLSVISVALILSVIGSLVYEKRNGRKKNNI